MHILFDYEIILSYLSLPLIKDEKEIMLACSFENSYNKFVLSKNRIDFFNEAMKDDMRIYNKWKEWLNTIISLDKVIMADDVESQITFENIHNVNLKTFDILQSKNSSNVHYFLFALNPQETYLNSLSHSCFYKDALNPNKDYILLGLLANTAIILRPIDYASNHEINLTFALFLQLSYNSKRFDWYDNYCNEHHLFDSIIGKGYEINIFTEPFTNDYENTARRIRLKEKYGKNNTKIKYSNDKKIIHPRRVYLDRFILETNHDFAAILRENDNWRLSIEYCYDDKLISDFEEIRNSYSDIEYTIKSRKKR